MVRHPVKHKTKNHSLSNIDACLFPSICVQNETLSEKEIKRLGFALAETRYNELLPLLARLNELEEQQADEERPSHHRGGGRGLGGGGGGSAAVQGSGKEKGKDGKEGKDKSGKGAQQQQQGSGKKGKDKK